MARVKLLNVDVDNLNMEGAVQAVEMLIKKKQPAVVVTPNLDHLVKLETDEEFRQVYDTAELILTDGQPLVWYSKITKNPIAEKVSGSDLFPEVCKMCAQKGYRVFLFGADTGVAEAAAKKLTDSYCGLKIAGTCSPEFGFENDPEKVRKYIDEIREADPDVLAVALGTPKGEKFSSRYKDELGNMVILNIGATFDFIAGNVRRAPQWMSRCGMEWLFRIKQDPKRLIGRYWNDIKMIIPLLRKYR